MFSVSSFSSFGFSGARQLPSASAVAAAGFFRRVPSGSPVLVGCAVGLDLLVRSAFPSARVFSSSLFPSLPPVAALARRSQLCVSSLLSLPSPLFVCFPASLPVVPGLGSGWLSGIGGSLSSLSFALSLGLPCLVFVPAGAPCFPPRSFSALGGGWFFRPAPPPSLSLF